MKQRQFLSQYCTKLW